MFLANLVLQQKYSYLSYSLAKFSLFNTNRLPNTIVNARHPRHFFFFFFSKSENDFKKDSKSKRKKSHFK
jgi:hypothetical protein